MADPRRVVHIHIPKCGGTTVTRYLQRLLGPENVAHFGHRGETAEFRRLPAAALEKYIAVGGHLSYDAFRAKLGAAPLYFAIFREPFDLFVSFYWDVAKRETHPLHNEAARLAPLDFLDHVASRSLLKPQLFYLGPNSPLNEAVDLLESGKIKADIMPNLTPFLARISRYLGRPPKALPHVNRSAREPIGDEDRIRAAVLKYYADDCRLYELVAAKSAEFGRLSDDPLNG